MPDPYLTNDPSQQSGGFLNQAGASTDWTAPMYGAPDDSGNDAWANLLADSGSGNIGDLPDLIGSLLGSSGSNGGISPAGPTSAQSSSILSALLGSGGGSGGMGGIGGYGASAGALLSGLLGLFNGSDKQNPGSGTANSLQLAEQNQMLPIEGAMGGLESGNPYAALVGAGIGQAEGVGRDFEGGAYGAGLANLFLGPMAAFLGNEIAPAGLPSSVKPQAFSTGLSDSGNPLEKLLGGYVETQGIQKGYDLSEGAGSNTPFNPDRFANVLEFLSGQNFPQYNGMLNAGGVGLGGIKNLSQLAGSNPTNQTLSMNQIKSIMPELESMVGGYKGKLSGLLPQVNGLAQKLYNAESY